MDTSSKTERAYLKLIFGTIGAVVLLIVLSIAGFRYYQHWQEQHLVRRGAAFLSGGNVKDAGLSARRALQINPNNPEAVRLMGDIAERAGDRRAGEWRRKSVDLQPHSTVDAFALVRTALRLNDLATAERTLNGLDAMAKETAEFHAASGRLAQIKNDRAGAESQWAKAAELAPNEKAYQLQLALVRLEMNDPAKRDLARADLERLRSDEKQRASATRALISDGASHHEDAQRLRSLAHELQAYPDALFTDRILYLEILRQLYDPEFTEYLATMEKTARAVPSDLAALVTWMTNNRSAADAIKFTTELPPETRNQWPVPLALADAYAKQEDWKGLERVCASSDWGGVDFLRHAYLTRAYRAQKNEVAALREWTAAQKAAAGQSWALSLLTRTVSGWGWQGETVELLWNLTKEPETRAEALQQLYQHYAQLRDTTGLFRALSRAAEIAPDDLTLQNNLAQISMLLEANPQHSRKIAAELKTKEPGNASFVSTYAFSLYSQGDVAGAVKAMNTLQPAQRDEPSIAAYYGIFLAAAGQKEQAAESLRRAVGARLLPEEEALVKKAEASLQ